MIDFDELKTTPVLVDVKAWCDQNATNHLRLLAAWEHEPKYATDLTLLLQCLAWATIKGKGVVAARILGKYRRLRQVQETEAFTRVFGEVPSCLL